MISVFNFKALQLHIPENYFSANLNIGNIQKYEN